MRAPEELVGGRADFSELLASIELLRGRDKAYADALAAVIPDAIRTAPCFLDRLTSSWLYDFGEPVVTEGGSVSGRGLTFHSVVQLADVVACARERLRPAQFDDYMRRLTDPVKHRDMLFEFAPILRLETDTLAEYEVGGESPRNRRIDWRISGTDGFTILLEVKNREADLIRTFESVQSGARASAGTVLPPDHDTDLMFRSVEQKFLERPAGEVPQGVWVGSELMQERTELRASFMKLNPEKVHFAIVGSWSESVHMLSRDDVPCEKVLQLLKVKRTDDLVFDRAAHG